uniref:Polyprenol reductase n=1 Tax=Rhabditophanes sp. KR3021 TaxID=114890 RepID=A0AC35U3R7_9BILA
MAENFIQVYLALACLAFLPLGCVLFADLKNGYLSFLRPLIFYGKTLSENNWLSTLSVRKSSFYQFYVVGAFLSGTFAIMALAFPAVLQAFSFHLTWFGYTYNPTSREVMVTLLLCFTIHTIRRLYECLFISSYSESRINVAHWIMGILHYTFFPCALVAESSFSTHSSISYTQLFFIFAFVLANYQQHIIARDFANLRKGSDGKVLNFRHKVCLDGLHKLVCCPHYFCEVIIYLAFVGISNFKSSNLIFFFIFVLANQLIAAKTNQIWYKNKFRGNKLVIKRKALIPYVF